jgi:hypothetical protein
MGGIFFFLGGGGGGLGGGGAGGPGGAGGGGGAPPPPPYPPPPPPPLPMYAARAYVNIPQGLKCYNCAGFDDASQTCHSEVFYPRLYVRTTRV